MSCFTRSNSTNAILLCGFLTSLAGACTSTRGGVATPTVVLDTGKVAEKPTDPPPLVFPRPRWETATYELTTQVVSEEQASGVRDSTRGIRHIQLQSQKTAGRATVLVRATVIDSTMASTPAVVDSGRAYQLTADGAFWEVTAGTTCSLSATTVSPLYARLLIPRYAITWPQADSLHYDTCIRGVHSRVHSLVTWQAPTLDGSRDKWLQQIRVSGRLSADSTKTLPLHLKGVLDGSATLTYPIDTAQVLQLTGRIVFGIEATSSTKQQHVQQAVILHAIRH